MKVSSPRSKIRQTTLMLFPPVRIELDHPHKIALRRATVDDAEMLAQAVKESLTHLHRFMPWSREPQSCDPVFQQRRLSELTPAWDRREQFEYVVCLRDNARAFLAALGMMTRLGPKTLELGYWVHANHEGKGYVRTASAALTRVALEMDGIDAVYICCDPENTRSIVIPQSLGFADEGIGNHPVSGASRMFSKRRAL